MQPLATDSDDAASDLPFPPKYGEHTRAVLGEAGYDAAQLDNLVATGVISCGEETEHTELPAASGRR